jgi:hypothetical protein
VTYEQTGKMLAYLVTVYTARLMPSIDKAAILAWAELLEDINGDKAMAIVKSWAKSNKYPPTIADIREGYYNEQRIPVRENPKPT